MEWSDEKFEYQKNQLAKVGQSTGKGWTIEWQNIRLNCQN